MLPDDTFLTIEAPAVSLFKDRGSKFHGFAYPVCSEEDVRDRWLALKELHPKAVHHCYAYRLGRDGHRFRANDDGEPSGSAGKPILNTLYSRGLTNTLVVVVRYFGGTLLGVPGLINAYKTASEEALDQAVVVTRFVTAAYRLSFAYERMNTVMKIVKDMNLHLRQADYQLLCTLETEVREAEQQEFLQRCGHVAGLEVTVL